MKKPQFIYYLPGAQTATPADLRERGIHALHGVSYDFLKTTQGPDGSTGIVLFPAGGDHPKRCQPDAQHWQPCGSYWIGTWRDANPPPAALERPELVQGHTVKLEDGNDWIIPVARRFPAGTALPVKLLLDDTGHWKAAGLERYAALTAAADHVYTAFLLDGEPLSLADMADIAVQALACNYRLGRWECSALGILSSDNVQAILGALIDLPTILAQVEADKKKHSDTSSSFSGWQD